MDAMKKEFLGNHFFKIVTLLGTFIFSSNGEGVDDAIFKREIVKSVIKLGTVEDEGGLFTIFRRENFCAIAQRKFSILYIDKNDDPEVHEYKFVYENAEVVQIAMHCPTLPSIYLHSGKMANEIMVVSVESVANKFQINFENPPPLLIELEDRLDDQQLTTNSILFSFNHHDRQNLCIEAYNNTVSIIIDNCVLNPHTYRFMYGNDRRTVNAIPCPTFPPTYVHTELQNIVITYSNNVNEIQIVRNIRSKGIIGQPTNDNQEENTSKKKSCHQSITKQRQEYELILELNKKLLFSLNEEQRESICIFVRKAIRYTIQIPETIDEPSLFEFNYGNNMKREEFAIRCSTDNAVFMYFGGWNANVKIVILKSKLMEQMTAAK